MTGRLGEGSRDTSGELRLDLQGAGCFEGRKQGAWKSNGGKEQTYPFQAGSPRGERAQAPLGK